MKNLISIDILIRAIKKMLNHKISKKIKTTLKTYAKE